MPTHARNESTRARCWTCRARRKKCDEHRPSCANCTALGLICEGYRARLKWLPFPKLPGSSSNNWQKEKLVSLAQRDEQSIPYRKEALLYYLGKEVHDSIPAVEREILQDCRHLALFTECDVDYSVVIDWGVSTLICAIDSQREKYFQIFMGSEALLASCLAYQSVLDPKHAPLDGIILCAEHNTTET